VANNGHIYHLEHKSSTGAAQGRSPLRLSRVDRRTELQGKEFCALSTPDGEIIVADPNYGRNTKLQLKNKRKLRTKACAELHDGTKYVAAAESNSEAGSQCVGQLTRGKGFGRHRFPPIAVEWVCRLIFPSLTLNNQRGHDLAYRYWLRE
jgi:hypothetical protein